jgi:hypothetical protein
MNGSDMLSKTARIATAEALGRAAGTAGSAGREA